MYLKTANFFSFDRLFLNIKCIHMCMDRIHNSYKGSFCKSPYYVDMGSFQFGLIIFLVVVQEIMFAKMFIVGLKHIF